MRVLRDLAYVFKTAPISSSKIKKGVQEAALTREECLLYVSNYINLFPTAKHQDILGDCLDLIWDCQKFENYFARYVQRSSNDSLPIAVAASASANFGSVSNNGGAGGDHDLMIGRDSSCSLDHKNSSSALSKQHNRGFDIRYQFEIHVTSAMKTAIHKCITDRLTLLKQECLDTAVMQHSFCRFDREHSQLGSFHKKENDVDFGNSINSINIKNKSKIKNKGTLSFGNGKLQLSNIDKVYCVYIIHDLYEFVEKLKTKHTKLYHATFNDFFDCNIETVLADTLANPSLQFIEDICFNNDMQTNQLRQQSNFSSDVHSRDGIISETSISNTHGNDTYFSKIGGKQQIGLDLSLNELQPAQIRAFLSEIEHLFAYFRHYCSVNACPIISTLNMVVDVTKPTNKPTEYEIEVKNEWLNKKRTKIIGPFIDHFINDMSSCLVYVERAINCDAWKHYYGATKLTNKFRRSTASGSEKTKKTRHSSSGHELLHGTSVVDVFTLIEGKILEILKHDAFTPLQIIKLAEMITSILVRYTTLLSELIHEQINETDFKDYVLSLELNRSYRRNSRNDDYIFEMPQKLITMIGSIAALKLSFAEFISQLNLENKYFIALARHRKDLQLEKDENENENENENSTVEKSSQFEKRTLSPTNHSNNETDQNEEFEENRHESLVHAGSETNAPTEKRVQELREHYEFHQRKNKKNSSINSTLILERVNPSLKHKKFFDAIETVLEDIGHHLGDTLSVLDIGKIYKVVRNAKDDSVNGKMHIDDSHTNLIDECIHNIDEKLNCFYYQMPKELANLTYYLNISYLSHLFIQIEKLLLPTKTKLLLKDKQVLTLNNIIGRIEFLLNEYNIINIHSHSNLNQMNQGGLVMNINEHKINNNKFNNYNILELNRIQQLIIIYLSNTEQVLEYCEQILSLKFDNNINMNDESTRRTHPPFVNGHILCFLLKYRSEKLNDLVAKNYVQNNSNDLKNLQSNGNTFFGRKETDQSEKSTDNQTSSLQAGEKEVIHHDVDANDKGKELSANQPAKIGQWTKNGLRKLFGKSPSSKIVSGVELSPTALLPANEDLNASESSISDSKNVTFMASISNRVKSMVNKSSTSQRQVDDHTKETITMQQEKVTVDQKRKLLKTMVETETTTDDDTVEHLNLERKYDASGFVW